MRNRYSYVHYTTRANGIIVAVVAFSSLPVNFHSIFVLFFLPRKVLVLQFVVGVALVCAPGLEPFLNLLATGSLYPGSLIRCVLGLIQQQQQQHFISHSHYMVCKKRIK